MDLGKLFLPTIIDYKTNGKITFRKPDWGTEIFNNEDVTKGSNFIHAWGWEKCTEYLTELNKSLKIL